MKNNRWQAYAQRGRSGRGRSYGYNGYGNAAREGAADFSHTSERVEGENEERNVSHSYQGRMNSSSEKGVLSSGERGVALDQGMAMDFTPEDSLRVRDSAVSSQRIPNEEDRSTSTSSLDDSSRMQHHVPSRGQRRRAESTNLLYLIQSIDGGAYGQLKSLTGRSFFIPFGISPSFSFRSSSAQEKKMDDYGIIVTFLQVQSDPFAPGSVIEIELSLPFQVEPLIYLRSTEGSHNASTISIDQGNSFSFNHREEEIRLIAGEDFLLRMWKACLFEGVEENELSEEHRCSPGVDPNYGASYSGRDQRNRAVEVIRISSHVIPRSATQLDPASSTVRFYLRVKLPGRGRRIDGSGICRILKEDLLQRISQLWSILDGSLDASSRNFVRYAGVGDDTLKILHTAESGKELMLHYIDHIHDQEWLRCQLPEKGLAAFVVNNAILPRAAGNSLRPMAAEECVCFDAPASLAVSFLLPRTKKRITGMGLPQAGLTVIAGGGFHGKSTLLRSLELGIYNHIPSDGRAFVVTDPTAVKIRAEDRRSVHGVNIETFISNLPFGKDTTCFTTCEASGSTSQAANIMEALELGAHTLLLDEDTSATNLMYRDVLVQALVPPKDEPITPLVERISTLLKEKRISFIIVVGGSGQYFQYADKVIVMNNYRARDATGEAKAISQQQFHHFSMNATSENLGNGTSVSPSSLSSCGAEFALPPVRHLDPLKTFSSLSTMRPQYRGSRGRGRGHSFSKDSREGQNVRIKVGASSAQRIRCAEEEIDLSLVEQLVEEGQLQAIAQCVALCYDKGSKWMEDVQRDTNREHTEGHCGLQKGTELYFHGDFFPASHSLSPPSLLPFSLVSSCKAISFPLGSPSHFARLVWSCEWALRRAGLELRTPSAYMPRGFSSLPRVMEIGAALNRLRTLRTRPL